MRFPPSSSSYRVQTRIGSRFLPGGRAILALYGATYLLGLIPAVEAWMVRNLLLRPDEVFGWRAYEVLTAPAIMTSFFALLFVGLLLYSIGSAVEAQTGTRRFVGLMASASVVAAVMAAAVGRLFGGAAMRPVLFDGQPVFLAVLVAFAHFYGSLPVRMWGIGEPISGRGLSYFFIGLALLADLLRHEWLQLVAELSAVGFMLLVFHRPWRGLMARLRRRVRHVTTARRRGTLEVLDGGRKDGPRWIN